VAWYAEQIVRAEKGDLAVVLSAAYLHDIGIHEAEGKRGSREARYQEEEGPPIARDILTKLGAIPELTEEVCDIVGHHHHPRSEETVNFKAVYDADLIVNLEETQNREPMGKEKLAALIEENFLTESGRNLAKTIFSTAEIAENAEKNI
jgi:hypothetical protein